MSSTLKASLVESYNNEYSFGSYHAPFVIQCLYNNDVRVKSARVWNYLEEQQDISLYLDIHNVEALVKMPSYVGFLRSVEDVLFANDLFIMSAIVAYRDDDDNVGGVCFFLSLAILIVDANGIILRDIRLQGFDYDAYVEYYLYRDMFLFEIEDRLFIFNTSLSKMLDKTLLFKEEIDMTDEEKRKKRTFLKHVEIRELVGRDALMLSKLEARKVQMASLPDGSMRLKIKSCNFWTNPYQP